MSTKTRVYISGSITGRPHHEALAQFAKAEEVLNHAGYEAVNPAKTGSHALDWFDNMTIALNYLRSCTYIYFLDGAENSPGSQVERIYADKLRITEIPQREYEEAEKTKTERK